MITLCENWQDNKTQILEQYIYFKLPLGRQTQGLIVKMNSARRFIFTKTITVQEEHLIINRQVQQLSLWVIKAAKKLLVFNVMKQLPKQVAVIFYYITETLFIVQSAFMCSWWTKTCILSFLGMLYNNVTDMIVSTPFLSVLL